VCLIQSFFTQRVMSSGITPGCGLKPSYNYQKRQSGESMPAEQKAETIVYEVGAGLYINITNRCPCNCTFCLRGAADGVKEGESLWLDHEPSLEEIGEALSNVDFSKYEEVVFCGYGEPCERLDELVYAAKLIRERTALPVRLNTNGLGDLINSKKTAPVLAQYINRVSISLNAPDKETYNSICRPVFGGDAYNAMIQFALECKALMPEVNFTVVDVLSEEQLRQCRELCGGLGIRLRVRKYV